MVRTSKVRIYMTEFTWDGTDYSGPNIVAKTLQEAELVCESFGCRIVGELTDVIVAGDEIETLH
jgi:hypothetical protein